MVTAEATAPTGADCEHCGLPVPASRRGASADPRFCCDGCLTIHALLHDHGLERYYVLRDGAAPAAPRPTRRSYDEMDDPGVQARIGGADASGLASAELYLEGVHCAACVWLVERLRALVSGVVESRLDLGRGRARVVWDPRVVSLSAIARALDALGYPPHTARGLAEQRARRREERWMLARIGVAGAVAANVMAIAFALYGGILDGMEPEFASFFRWLSLVPVQDVPGGRRRDPTGPLMAVMFVLLPVALAFAAGALALFLWAVRTGQFDDLDTPPLRILVEDGGETDSGSRSRSLG